MIKILTEEVKLKCKVFVKCRIMKKKMMTMKVIMRKKIKNFEYECNKYYILILFI